MSGVVVAGGVKTLTIQDYDGVIVYHTEVVSASDEYYPYHIFATQHVKPVEKLIPETPENYRTGIQSMFRKGKTRW